MIPIHLTLRGFLSYLDPVDIDFTCFDLACISGANGAGKSSLLDAITWALFGQARKTDDSVINSHAGDKTAEVTFEFFYEGNNYCVRRSKTRDKATKLEFLILLKPDSSYRSRPTAWAWRLEAADSDQHPRNPEGPSKKPFRWIMRPLPMRHSSCREKPTSFHSKGRATVSESSGAF